MTNFPITALDPDVAVHVTNTLRDLTDAGNKVFESIAIRNELIISAVIAGISQRKIAAATGLSHTAIQNIVKRGH